MDATAAFMVERILAAGLARPEEVIGCSEEEIRALEVIHKVRLPRAYRDFLAAMGHGAGRMFNPWEGWGFQFDCVKYLNWHARFAHDLLSSGARFPMPETAFFIGTMQSIDYWFLDLADGSDDPPVWGYGDSWAVDNEMPPLESRRVAAGIWDLVEAELEDRVAVGDRLARMGRGLFDGEPGADEARAVEELRLRGLRQQWEEHQRRCKARRADPNYDDEIPF